MLLNVLSVGYKLGKTTSAQLVVLQHVWWAEGTWCLCINVQRDAMQLSRTGIPDFLEISCCTARISQIQMICIHFQPEVLSFSRRPILFVHFPQRSFVDVRTIFGNAIRSNFTSIYSSIILCSALSKVLHNQALFIFRIHTTFWKNGV